MIPMTLGDSSIDLVIPKEVQNQIFQFKHLIVENIKTTRRYLRKMHRDFDIDGTTFYELNKHTNPSDISSYLEACVKGENVGVISEAGCPGIADPGASVVEIAHQRGIDVIPFTGPSSILLALISSGMNGQQFKFRGYISKDRNSRVSEIKSIQTEARKGCTQIFMETPFRNNNLLEDLLSHLAPDTKLCVAANITTSEEFIKTKTVKDWKQTKTDLHKQPVIFLVG